MTNNQENLSKENKIYTVLSIGQRGAGKTVLLTASYRTFKNQTTSGNRANIVLSSQEEESEEDIEKFPIMLLK